MAALRARRPSVESAFPPSQAAGASAVSAVLAPAPPVPTHHGAAHPAAMSMLLGGVSASVAAAVSHPLDLVKTATQVSGSTTNPITVTANILNQEGIRGVTKGVSASIARQLVYSSTRFAAYDVLKPRLNGIMDSTEAISPATKVTSGLLAGVIGAGAGCPFDVALLRMQADNSLPASERRSYKNVLDALVRVTNEEGFAGLYKGIGPTMARAAVVTAGQLGTYDIAKDAIVAAFPRYVDEKSTAAHVGGGLLAGMAASVVGNPIDVIRARLMTAGPGSYSGVLDCVRSTVLNDGVLSLQRGLFPNMARQVPYVTVMFVVLETLKSAVEVQPRGGRLRAA